MVNNHSQHFGRETQPPGSKTAEERGSVGVLFGRRRERQRVARRLFATQSSWMSPASESPSAAREGVGRMISLFE
jgi:hypothetical protein